MHKNIDELIKNLKTYNPNEIPLAKKAYLYARNAHDDHWRKSGEPYIIHPIAVATYLAKELQVDGASIAAALLHDTVEDNDKITVPLIEQQFNKEIAILVSGVSKLKGMNFRSDELFLANTRKLILSITRDVRIIMIKLADRLHNMQTLMHMKPEKQLKIANETMEIYVPIAYRLGAYKIMRELQNLAFYYSHPHEQEFTRIFNQIKEQSYPYLRKMLAKIRDELTKANINSQIDIDYKNDFEIYKKLETFYAMDDIYDLRKLKIKTDTLEECDLAMRIVRKLYHSLSRDNDYISVPKENKYQASHSLVLGPDSRLVQVQVMTHEMEKTNDYGVFSLYYTVKGEAKEKMQEITASFPFVKVLRKMGTMNMDNEHYLAMLKDELFCITIRVYSADTGEMLEIAKGSRVIDYAFRTDQAYNMSTVIVNGQKKDFDYVLKNNDIIRILTCDYETVNESWRQHAARELTKKLIDERLKK